jgi:hypothetical protein
MKTCGITEVLLHHSSPRHYTELIGQLHAPAAILLGKEPSVLIE